MKKGDLVRKLSTSNGKILVGLVLEAKTSDFVMIGQAYYRKKRTEIRILCPEAPRMTGYFEDARDWEVISELK
jgi:hypothetical protein